MAAPPPFRNFVAQARLGVSQEEHEAFFRQLLGDVDEPTAPFGLLDVRGDGSGIGEARMTLEAGLAQRVRQGALMLGVSAASLFHLAWALVLARTSGREDVVFGTVLFGRMQGGEDADRVMGLLMNTLPVRIQVGEEAVEASVRGVHALLANLLRHEHASLALAQRCCAVPPPAPLFTTLLNYRHSQGMTLARAAEAKWAWEGMEVVHSEERTNYPLTLSVDDLGTDFVLTAQVQTSIGPKRICEFMHTALERLVEALDTAPKVAVHTLDVLPDWERQQVLYGWNETTAEFPRGKCLHELFEQQVSKTPQAPAVAFEGESLTYKELNRRADLLAHHLRTLGVRPDGCVAICVERSLEMMVGVMGILKAGAAYLPIDPAFPRDRIAFMLADARAGLLLTQTTLLAPLPIDTNHALCLDVFDWADSEVSVQNDSTSRGEHLAYVIYTSGSTGRPKGVCIEHRNIVNYVCGIAERLQLQPGMNYATVSTLATDLGNTVIFPALATGGCVHLVSSLRAESQTMLADYFQREDVDILKIVPSHLAALQAGRNPERVMPGRSLILGGESSRRDWVERLRALSPGSDIHNHYGPTETTVGVLMYRVGSQLPNTASGNLPLGRPLPNTRVYILDRRGQPVPIGVPGELVVGGLGVARGYLNCPDLTAARFDTDPFSSERDGRLYRTGDLARHLPDGNIEFLGRIDDQVKIRGHRVELGEIGAALCEQAGVHDAVVLAREDQFGQKQLVAYLVAKRAEQPLWENKTLHMLPDGSPVMHLNRNETDYIYREIFVLQAYLRHGITITDGDCILDAGANIGLFSFFVSRLARNLQIFSFEPNPAAFDCLKTNTRVWGKHVRCLPFGLSRENTTGDMTFFEGLSLLSGFYADTDTEREVVRNYVFNQYQDSESLPSARMAADIGELISERLRQRTVKAQLRTLSSVIAEEGIDRVDLLKINVEKSELHVLEGLSESDWPKIRQLVIEVDREESVRPITILLEQHGYEFLIEQDALLKDTQLCYIYAVRPSSSGRLIREQGADAHVRSLIPADESVLTRETLRKHLNARLPHYMVPSFFVLMDKLPLTRNGKVDRKALPAPDGDAQARSVYQAPQGEIEAAIAVIWTEVLKVKRVGRDDNFFELGGHSLLAVQVLSRVQDTLQREVSLAALFRHAVLRDFAATLGHGIQANLAPIPRVERDGPVPLSFSQQRLWFLAQLEGVSRAYHLPGGVRLRGDLDRDALKRALDRIVSRHEALRTRFEQVEGQPIQVIAAADIGMVVHEHDLCASADVDCELARWAQMKPPSRSILSRGR